MPSTEARRHAFELAIFAVPIVIVKLSGGLLGAGGPVALSAAPIPVAAVPVPVVAAGPDWTERQVAAAAYVDWLHRQPFETTPMYYEARAEVPDRDPTPTTDPTPRREEVELDVDVTAIMGRADESMVVIDGSIHRIGDRIDAGRWEVTMIDSERRSIVLTHLATGQMVLKSVPLR